MASVVSNVPALPTPARSPARFGGGQAIVLPPDGRADARAIDRVDRVRFDDRFRGRAADEAAERGLGHPNADDRILLRTINPAPYQRRTPVPAGPSSAFLAQIVAQAEAVEPGSREVAQAAAAYRDADLRVALQIGPDVAYSTTL